MAGLDGVLTLQPVPGDGPPEIAWGDMFFYHSPEGVVAARTQLFATVVTKNYPGDEASRLARPDTFRVNIFAGKQAFIRGPVTRHTNYPRPRPTPAWPTP